MCPVVVLCWTDDFPGDVRALPRTALVAWSYWRWGRNVLTGRACGRAFRGRWIWDLVWRMGTNGILGWTGGLINPASETEIRASRTTRLRGRVPVSSTGVHAFFAVEKSELNINHSPRRTVSELTRPQLCEWSWGSPYSGLCKLESLVMQPAKIFGDIF